MIVSAINRLNSVSARRRRACARCSSSSVGWAAWLLRPGQKRAKELCWAFLYLPCSEVAVIQWHSLARCAKCHQ
jgi:hypothetical protein